MPATEGSANRFSTGTLQLSKWSTCQTILMPKFFVRQVACPSWAPVASHENAWKWFWPLWHQSCGCSSGSGKTLHATKLDSSGWRLLGGPKGLCQENERNDLFLDLKLANLQIDFVLLKSPRPCCFGIRIPFPTDLGLYENTVAQMVRSIIIFHIDMAVSWGQIVHVQTNPNIMWLVLTNVYIIYIYIYILWIFKVGVNLDAWNGVRLEGTVLRSWCGTMVRFWGHGTVQWYGSVVRFWGHGTI